MWQGCPAHACKMGLWCSTSMFQVCICDSLRQTGGVIGQGAKSGEKIHRKDCSGAQLPRWAAQAGDHASTRRGVQLPVRRRICHVKAIIWSWESPPLRQIGAQTIGALQRWRNMRHLMGCPQLAALAAAADAEDQGYNQGQEEGA